MRRSPSWPGTGSRPRKPPRSSASRRTASASACTAPGTACGSLLIDDELRGEQPPRPHHDHAPTGGPRMSTRLDTDPELLDLVRAADPMLDPRVHTNAGLDTESALPPARAQARSPTRAPARPSSAPHGAARRGPRRRGPGSRVRGGQRHLDRNGSDAVSRAQAQTILRHVRAALVFPPRAIYEEDAVTTVTARDGARFTYQGSAVGEYQPSVQPAARQVLEPQGSVGAGVCQRPARPL